MIGPVRHALVLAAALAASSCGAGREAAPSADGCARTAAHAVTWSNPDAPDVVTARADGPRCAQAVATFVVRNAAGDPLWAFASTYHDLTIGGAPGEDAAEISADEVDRFLSGWADVTISRSGSLPAWREGFPTLTESATTFAYETPFDRETYEMLRSRDLPMICYAAAVAASQCLVIDPVSRTPTMIVAYGP